MKNKLFADRVVLFVDCSASGENTNFSHFCLTPVGGVAHGAADLAVVEIAGDAEVLVGVDVVRVIADGSLVGLLDERPELPVTVNLGLLGDGGEGVAAADGVVAHAIFMECDGVFTVLKAVVVNVIVACVAVAMAAVGVLLFYLWVATVLIGECFVVVVASAGGGVFAALALAPVSSGITDLGLLAYIGLVQANARACASVANINAA